MEWQRLVEIHDANSGQFGTGYLLANRLVLTAAHVVDGLDTTQVRLFEPDEDGLPGPMGGRTHARVAWSGGTALDLALLTPLDAPFRSGRIRPASVARLAERPAVRVDALGFPRAMDTPAHSDTLHVEALVSAWTGLRGQALVLDVQTARPEERDAWQGMSGAAVFAGDRIVAVIAAVPAKLARSALRATRADLAFHDQAAAALLEEAGLSRTIPAVDAAYVDSLPRAGHWGEVRDRYTRSVVTNLCRIDHVGFSVAGGTDRRTPALAAFTAQRFSLWPKPASRTR
ncbi:MAG TPA: trypsin-like peptidase domain-containing protein [Vicinamibacterales bacterium]|nr:trypsin-like peptidase domain-containing protein [Vicinamibacterales bacterium]